MYGEAEKAVLQRVEGQGVKYGLESRSPHAVAYLTYGSHASDWCLWQRHQGDHFAGEFWDMIAHPELRMPGAWTTPQHWTPDDWTDGGYCDDSCSTGPRTDRHWAGVKCKILRKLRRELHRTVSFEGSSIRLSLIAELLDVVQQDADWGEGRLETLTNASFHQRDLDMVKLKKALNLGRFYKLVYVRQTCQKDVLITSSSTHSPAPATAENPS